LKIFYGEKRFGFIACDEMQGDIFVHQTNFLDNPPEGRSDVEVEFQIDNRKDRPRAVNVRIHDVPAAAGRSGAQEGPQRMRGRIRAFRPEKGYGFISRDGDADVFVHADAFGAPELQPEKCIGSSDTPAQGQEVEFTIDLRSQRPRAIDARIIGEALSQPRMDEGGYQKRQAMSAPSCGDSRQALSRGAGEQPEARCEQYEVLANALAEVLAHTETLEYVRHDNFTLLNEVLSMKAVRLEVEALGLGRATDLEGMKKPPLPSALKAVREITNSFAEAGCPRFELWEEEGADGWIRLAVPPKDTDQSENSRGGGGCENHDNSQRDRERGNEWGRYQKDFDRSSRDKNRNRDHEQDRGREKE